MEIVNAQQEYLAYKRELDAELNKAADSFVKIGYLLRRAEDTDILKESGYKSVTEFAAAEYGLTRDVVSRYMNINKKYSLNGYSDKLEDRYKGFGMAKLAEMLTLPASISDALPDSLSKSEIREIKKEYEAEQNITDMEVAIEAAELEAAKQETGQGISKQADTDKYDVVYYIIKYWLHDNPKDFLKLCDGIEESKDEEFVKGIIAPDGTKVIITRVPGVGKLMMTCKADEGIEIVNMRSSETKKAEWTEVDDAVIFLCAKDEGETYKDIWQREYKESYPEVMKEPEKTKAPERTKTPAKKKKTERRKQSKVAVVNKKEPEQLAQHEENNSEKVAAVQEAIADKSEVDNNKAVEADNTQEASDNSYVAIRGYYLDVNTENDELYLYDENAKDKTLETWDMQLMTDELEKVMNSLPMSQKERQQRLEGYYDAYTDAFEMSKKSIRDEMFEMAQDYYLKAGEILEKIINLPESEEE